VIGMTDDDLNAPLGQFPVRKRPSLSKIFYAGVTLGGLGLFGALGAFFPWPGKLSPPEHHRAGVGFPAPGTDSHKTTQQESPASSQRSSTEASASLPDTPVPSTSFPSTSFPSTQGTVLDQTVGLGAEAIERRSGVKVIRPGGGVTPGALIIDVATALNTRLAGAPDPRLIEQTRYGPVPRIGPDGARPAEIYARAAVSLPGLPRIALLVGGMGLSPHATEAAIAGLPGAVTLGSRLMEPILPGKPLLRARPATSSSWKFRWSPSIFRMTILARIRSLRMLRKLATATS
jgi:hypothetical protein